MYTMLLEEIRWALEEKEPYSFTHYLILSKTYREVESKLDAEDSRPSKKKKKDSSGGSGEVFYFHPEDEVLQRHALAVGSFGYEKVVDEGKSDSKRAFSEAGILPQGHAILIEADKFEGAVEAIAEYLRPPGS
jgi:protein BCP1